MYINMKQIQVAFTFGSGFGIEIMLYKLKSFLSQCLAHAMLELLKHKCFLIRLNLDNKINFAYCCLSVQERLLTVL